jgi:hypothetical protein
VTFTAVWGRFYGKGDLKGRTGSKARRRHTLALEWENVSNTSPSTILGDGRTRDLLLDAINALAMCVKLPHNRLPDSLTPLQVDMVAADVLVTVRAPVLYSSASHCGGMIEDCADPELDTTVREVLSKQAAPSDLQPHRFFKHVSRSPPRW